MSEIFVVFSQVYDDCEINAIFSNKKVAEKYSVLLPDAELLTFELDNQVDTAMAGYTYWQVPLTESGIPKQVQKCGPDILEKDYFEVYYWGPGNADTWRDMDAVMIFTHVRAKTEEEAVENARIKLDAINRAGLWGNADGARQLLREGERKVPCQPT